jgi:molybdate transport system substrate-binding protein
MRGWVVGVLALGGGQSIGGDIRVAVASNFADTLRAVAERFGVVSGHSVTLSPGSTGKHYAQIKNGAPFDLFFAADRRRPELLEQGGLARKGSRFTYALGKVVLWSSDPGLVDPEGRVLQSERFRHLAIANPRLAPYGKAAQEVLQARRVWNRLRPRLVRGENISQTYLFVRSRNAELGFVAYSQLVRGDQPIEGSWWDVPQTLYTPIEQQAVLLKEGEVARAFLVFVQSAEAKDLIRTHGYRTP